MTNQISNQDEQFEKDKANAKTFGGAVYVGGVIAATILFITFVLTAFPQEAYFTRVVMTLAGAAVGCSMLAFPVALHKWAVTKDHRWWTTLLYYGEMLFISVNTIVSFVNLLAKYTGFQAPQWAILYEPFSVLSIIYVIFAWGTIFLKDPQAQRMARMREFDEKYEEKISTKTLEFLDTQQGEDAIIIAASEDIQNRIAKRSSRGNFGTGELVVDPKKGFVKKELSTELQTKEANPFLFKDQIAESLSKSSNHLMAWKDMADGSRFRIFCKVCKREGRPWFTDQPCEHVVNATDPEPVSMEVVMQALMDLYAEEGPAG